MLIAKNNFLESPPVQLRLNLSRKSEFYSMFYSDFENFDCLIYIPIQTLAVSESKSGFGLRDAGLYYSLIFKAKVDDKESEVFIFNYSHYRVVACKIWDCTSTFNIVERDRIIS